MVPGPPAHDEILRIRIDCLLLLDAAAYVPDELEIESLSEAARNLALCLRKVSAVVLKPVGPHVRAAFGVDQLHVHLHLITGPPHAAFEDIPNAEFAAYLLHVDELALVGKGRAAGYYEATGNARQIGGQIVGDPIGEILLLRIVREIPAQDRSRDW